MKVYQNNWWNRIFHKEELARQACERVRYKRMIKAADEFLERINSCDTLIALFFLHKEMWCRGLQNSNLGPDMFGMFRTKNISLMKLNEVFLGNIYGLWTYDIPEWENCKEQAFGPNSYGIEPTVTVYQVVVEQYKHHLLSNVKSISQEAEKKLTALGGQV